MGNFVGARGSSFSHRGLWIAKNSVTIEFIYKKLQRNEGCSRRLIALRIYTARNGSMPLAPGTNLIAGFVGYRPLTHWQKKNEIGYLGRDPFNQNFRAKRTGPTEKSGPPRKVGQFFWNFSGWTEPIHSVLDRNFRKFWLNGSRPWFLLITIFNLMNRL